MAAAGGGSAAGARASTTVGCGGAAAAATACTGCRVQGAQPPPPPPLPYSTAAAAAAAAPDPSASSSPKPNASAASIRSCVSYDICVSRMPCTCREGGGGRRAGNKGQGDSVACVQASGCSTRRLEQASAPAAARCMPAGDGTSGRTRSCGWRWQSRRAVQPRPTLAPTAREPHVLCDPQAPLAARWQQGWEG